MKYLNRIIFILSIFLVGCSSVKTPVGPICVSCKPYYCRGTWHYPQTYYEYCEVGLASWYGDAFHGKAKASGELFDKNALTAAHRTLPIPSVVKVTNLRNGLSIVVIVDDRGPFVYEGRIIDLSYGVAKILDLHKFRPSNVKIECLVNDSMKLSQYIARHCKRKKDPLGRTWWQIYHQEIAKISKIKYYNKSFIKKQIASPKKTRGCLKKQPISKQKQNKPHCKNKMEKRMNFKNKNKTRIS